MRNTASCCLASAVLVAASACSTEKTATQPANAGTAVNETPADTGTPTGSTARPDPNAKQNEPAAGAPLVFNGAEGWVEEPPSSGMRKAQFRLPGAPAGGNDAELVVFHFGGSGGDVQANIDRWVSQFEQPDGSSSSDKVLHSQRRVDGMLVHEVDLSGTFVAETAPGSGERVNEAGSRMLASIIESDHGPYFVKLVGEKAVVDHWAASYRGFVTQTKRRR